MALQRNYYEVLGIPPGATSDQIKKKYRELARKYHPDIAQDKVLGQRYFSQINQAYHVLGNPDLREQYNSQLTATNAAKPVSAAPAPPKVQAQPKVPVQPVSPQVRPVAPSAPKAQTPPARQTVSVQPTPPQARPQSAPQADPGAAQKAQAIAGRLKDAENAIMAGKAIEARAFCAKALEIDPRSVRALEILGDALVLLGQREDAAVQYRNALQVAPSGMIQAKLNRLEQETASTRTNPPGGDTDKTGGGLFGRFRGKK